jgi:HNH endonuclease
MLKANKQLSLWETTVKAFIILKQGGASTMPRKAKHPCHHPGCPNLTEGRFCEEHQKEENKCYEKYHRDPATRKRYGRAWKRIRDSYVKTHPFCELCYEQGRLAEVEEVHHKIPLSEGGTHDKTNLISLCKSCHARIHAERGDRWHNHNDK